MLAIRQAGGGERGSTEVRKDGGCLGELWLGGWGHMIRDNKKATVVRLASNYTHTHTRTYGELPIWPSGCR